MCISPYDSCVKFSSHLEYLATGICTHLGQPDAQQRPVLESGFQVALGYGPGDRALMQAFGTGDWKLE